MNTEETKEQRLARLESLGFLDPQCPGCREWYESPTGRAMAPSHKPSLGCQSGKRPHCTCDWCF